MEDYLGEISYYNCGKVIHGDFQRAHRNLQNMVQDFSGCSNKSLFDECISSACSVPLLTLGKVWTVVYQRKEDKFLLEKDRNCSWGMTYVENGSLDNVIDGVHYNIGQDEVVLYNERNRSIQWIGSNTPVSFYTVFFDMDLQQSVWSINNKFLADYEMKELMHKIFNEKSRQNYFSEEIIACYLKEFILKMLRYVKSNKLQDCHIDKASGNEECILVEKSIEYIDKNISKKITVADIAESIHVSKSYLFKIFKKHMNVTIVEYINNTRLEKSRQLILSSNYKLTEIAYILGYTSIHYFSNQFKLKYGVNPSKYAGCIKS